MSKNDIKDFVPATDIQITNSSDEFILDKQESEISNNGSFSRQRENIFDLANSFLYIESMTHKKLQKLCYYAKAWYLAIYGENLITEQFEAWVHGAVQPDLYQEYKYFGFSYIPRTTETECSGIPEEYVSFAREVYAAYGEFDGDQLEKLNHSELPWKNARKNLKPWENSSNVISEEDMKTYYRTLLDEK